MPRDPDPKELSMKIQTTEKPKMKIKVAKVERIEATQIHTNPLDETAA
jgi:hypothetical protein